MSAMLLLIGHGPDMRGPQSQIVVAAILEKRT